MAATDSLDLGLDDLVLDVHLHHAAAAGRRLHLDVRRRGLDGHADAAATSVDLHSHLSASRNELEPLFHEAERHG